MLVESCRVVVVVGVGVGVGVGVVVVERIVAVLHMELVVVLGFVAAQVGDVHLRSYQFE